MLEVHVIDGNGDRVYGPFASQDDAEAERFRWVCTGGCTTLEIRNVATDAEVFADGAVGEMAPEVPAEEVAGS